MKLKVYQDGMDPKQSWRNRLADASSHYLRQHGEQPIDWYTWGDEAFEQARRLNRPVLISVGYAACHWCHVMARESFSDVTVAGLLNAHFIAIKVDREEHPAVDAFCIQTLLQLQGDAGWPANVFVSPECVPLMGGTYYPLYYQYGLPGFADVLRNVESLWSRQNEQMFDTGKHVLEAFGTRVSEDTQVRFIAAQWETEVDTRYGGFGWGAKFPMVPRIDFMLAHLQEQNWNTVLLKHLEAIDKGGIHDHVGGGFHRYTVDVDWAVPHYEKMLCDNALLARVFMRYHALHNHPHFRSVGCDTLEWLMREMKDESGLFSASVDAEDPQGEGYFYTWTQQELRLALGSDAEQIINTYSVNEYGNTGIGRSTLIRDGHPSIIVRHREKLRAFRSKRPPPRVDDKLITAWNAMAACALCMGYRVVREPNYLEAAKKIGAVFASEKQSLLPRVVGQKQIGTLEDQAWVLELWLELYSCTADPFWLKAVKKLLPETLKAFANPDHGLQLQHGSVGLPVPLSCADDTSEPSALSVMMQVLEIAVLIGGLGVDEKQLATLWSRVGIDMSASTLCGLHSIRGQFKTIVATGISRDTHLWRHALQHWRPYTYVFPESEFPSQLLSGKQQDEPALWPCVGMTCQLPVTDVSAFPLFEQKK